MAEPRVLSQFAPTGQWSAAKGRGQIILCKTNNETTDTRQARVSLRRLLREVVAASGTIPLFYFVCALIQRIAAGASFGSISGQVPLRMGLREARCCP